MIDGKATGKYMPVTGKYMPANVCVYGRIRAVLLLLRTILTVGLGFGVYNCNNARAEGGTKTDPDLQVGGYTVFGTNVTGATIVTSGWGNVYMDGSLQVHSNLHVDGQIVNTNLVQITRQSLTQHDQFLAQGSTIQPVSSYLRVRGETLPVTLGNPQIAAGQPGQLLTLQGINNLMKVTLVNGDGLRTSQEQPFALGAFDIIQLIYDDSSGNWVEINRSRNRWEN